MQTTWVVAADSYRARIFEMDGKERGLHEVADLVNPAARDEERDLQSDATGRFLGKTGPQAHTDEPAISPEEHETERFSRAVSDYLERARLEHRYDELRLVAYPKFLGLMRRNLSKETRQLVTDEVPKDISWLGSREIAEYLKNRH